MKTHLKPTVRHRPRHARRSAQARQPGLTVVAFPADISAQQAWMGYFAFKQKRPGKSSP